MQCQGFQDDNPFPVDFIGGAQCRKNKECSGMQGTCVEKMLGINANSYSCVDGLIKETFTENPATTIVYRNMDFTKEYLTWVEEGNAPDKTVPYKKISSYPYPVPQFEIGDFISFYDGRQNMTNWFLEALDSQVYYNVVGRLIPLNQKVCFRLPNNEVVSTYVSFQDRFNYTNYKFSAKGVVIPSGMTQITTQQNCVTDYWHKNTRLVIGEAVFKIQQCLRQLTDKYVKFYLTEDSQVPEDDMERGIAWNEWHPVITENGINISPMLYSLLQGTERTFDVRYYLSGVAQGDTFDITASGALPKCYQFTSTPNSFTLKNIQRSIDPVVVHIVDKLNGATSDVSIRLQGEY